MSTHPAAFGQGHVVDDPTDLTREEYVDAAKRAVAELKDDDVPGLAAGVAFRIFLAIFPSLLAAVAVFSMVTTPSEIREWLAQASAFMPSEAIDLLDRPLERLAAGGGEGAGITAVVGVLVGLFAATSAAVSLMKALSRAYDTGEDRKFVKQRLQGLAITLALLAALISLVLLLVVGRQLQDALLPGLAPPLSWVVAALRFIVALAVLVLLFAFVYWLGPDREQPHWLWISPGAIVGLVGWLLVAGGFTLYARTAGNYDATYGAVAGVAVLLIWLQLSMLALLAGAEFNAEVERARALRRAVGEGAGFAAPAATTPGVAPDAESMSVALEQTQRTAHSVQPAPAGDHDTDELPVASVPRKTASAATAGKAGAVAAAVMAAAVFLGFARRRARR